MQKRKIIIGVSTAAGFALAVLLYFYFTLWQHTETTDNAYVQADISVISAKITGYVDEILVKDNQYVSKGETLIILKPIEYAAKLQESQASINLAQANIDTIDAKLNLQNSLIIEAQANVEVSQAEAQRSEKEYKRALDLTNDDFISRKKFEESNAIYIKAIANVKKANAALESARQQIPILKNQRLENEAKLLQSQADFQVAQDNFDNTKIVSPINGVIGNKTIQMGQLVRPGQQLLSVVPNQPYIYANFKETQMVSMNKNQQVDIKIDAYPQLSFKGYIDSISPASGAVFSLLPPENATGNFTKIVQRIPVKIVIKSCEYLQVLRPGMSAFVRVYTRDNKPS